MSQHATGFDFMPWVPGFDFLQQSAQAAAQAQTQTQAQAQMPGAGPAWSQWLAPTLDPQEAARRIQELKTVLFWLEQNATALKATIQALEVQQLACQTLQDMQAHWMGQATGAHAAGHAGAAATAAVSPAAGGANTSADTGAATAAAGTGPSDEACQNASAQAGQWWGSLLHTFGQIAQQAQQEVAQRQAAFMQAQGQATTPTTASATTSVPDADNTPAAGDAANITQARTRRRTKTDAAPNRATQTPPAAPAQRRAQTAKPVAAKSTRRTQQAATSQPKKQRAPSATAQTAATKTQAKPAGAKKVRIPSSRS